VVFKGSLLENVVEKVSTHTKSELRRTQIVKAGAEMFETVLSQCTVLAHLDLTKKKVSR
jgi:hypothetical protein